jgi:hypothetical protein
MIPLTRISGQTILISIHPLRGANAFRLVPGRILTSLTHSRKTGVLKIDNSQL